MTLSNQERASLRAAINYLRNYDHARTYEVRSALAALRQIDTAPVHPADAERVAHAATRGDSFETLLADMGEVVRGFPSTTTAGFYDRLRDLVAAEMLNEEQDTPEVVPRDKVNDLPRGSRVVGATAQGQAITGATVREVSTDEKLGFYHYYLVLDRAPQPPIKVGDVIPGERVDELPEGSIVQSNRRQYDPYPMIKSTTGWRMGPGDPVQTIGRGNDYRVLAVGRS